MKYFQVNFRFSPVNGVTDTVWSPTLVEDACDLTAALAADTGFETFEQTDEGLTGYVQQPLFDEEALRSALEDFPLQDVQVSFDVSEAPDEDWNAEWEQQGFEPITVGPLVIHDGRHLPATINGAPTDTNFSDKTLPIEIDAKMAFGTGTHETTRMVCATLLEQDLKGCRVLDCGTGTGILSIAALKLGADSAVGYDIDEWSVDNARHNAVINHVDEHFTSLLGDASVLQDVEGDFDLVTANINRNILLQDMPAFYEKLKKTGALILSGFYRSDIPLLENKANKLGLQLISQKEDNEWACICLRNI
ncbi:MAG: 50S ribosomal protein L11 methyltransferase [Prevotella sp.]|nr:50S ribosomal protein L11 methyltransferase [Prevotella sp.]